MSGLAVISEKHGPVGAHRILLLVQGINMSILDFYGKAERIEDQSFKVTLVLVVAVTLAEDGSSFLATVEHMQKIGADVKASLLKSLDTEWKSVLLDQPPRGPITGKA
jgi:hypothetical protein